MDSIILSTISNKYHLARGLLRKLSDLGYGLGPLILPSMTRSDNLLHNQYIRFPTIQPDKAYFYSGSIPSAKSVVVGVADILSTIHPMYVLVSLVFLFAFLALYIKAKYPFWNQVPGLHVYDWHRRRLYSEKPYIVHRLPKRTKYYVPSPVVQSSRFSDLNPEKQMELVKLLQSHYLASDRVFCSIQLPDLAAQCASSMISTYNSVAEDVVIREIGPIDGSSGEIVERIQVVEGFIASRTVHISVSVGKADKRYIVLEPAHYMDYVCFHRTLVTAKKTRGLFHTHEFNQRAVLPDKNITLFKKEVVLCDALVPLVKYDALTFYLRYRVEPPSQLPTNFQMVRIQKEHQNHLQDWLDRVVSLKEDIGFRVSVVAETGDLLKQLMTNQLFAYALRGPESDGGKRLDTVYAIYFFRNAHVKYEDLEAGDTAHCVAAFCNTNNFDLYFLGFIWAVREVKKDFPGVKMLMMDDIGHVRGLARKWTETHDVVLRTPCAYYLTNYIVPRSNYREDDVLVLV